MNFNSGTHNILGEVVTNIVSIGAAEWSVSYVDKMIL